MTTSDAIAQLLAVPNSPVDGWRWNARKKDRTGLIMDEPDAGAPKPLLEAYRAFEGYEYREPRADEVCKAAGVELDAGVGACVLSSEVDRTRPAYLLACAHALINDATTLFRGLDGRRAPDAIMRRATAHARANFRFGRQAGDHTARYCSSFQPPTQRTLAAMRLALAGVGADLAQGARRWIDFRTQDGGKQAGETLPKTDAVLRSRYEEGWRLVHPDPRIDQYELGLLAWHDGVSLDEAFAMLARGRSQG